MKICPNMSKHLSNYVYVKLHFRIYFRRNVLTFVRISVTMPMQGHSHHHFVRMFVLHFKSGPKVSGGFGSMSLPHKLHDLDLQSSNIVPVWFRFRSLFRMFKVPSIGIKCGELGTSFSKNGWIFHAADDSEASGVFPQFSAWKMAARGLMASSEQRLSGSESNSI